MSIIDFLSGINLLLVLSSFIISVALMMALRENEYVLAKGWKFMLPAVFAFSLLQVYSFFTEYSLYNTSRLLKECLLFGFASMLFWGLLVQYLAVQQALDARK
jgi:hypothetical protein